MLRNAGLSPQDAPSTAANENGRVAGAHGAGGSDLPTDFSLPLNSGAHQSYLDLPLGTLTPEDALADQHLQDDLVEQSKAVLGTGGVRTC